MVGLHARNWLTGTESPLMALAGFQNTVMLADLGFPGANCCSLCGLLVLTDQLAEDPAALDLRFGKVPSIIDTAVRWPEVAGPVRAVLICASTSSCCGTAPPRSPRPAARQQARTSCRLPSGGCWS